MPQRTRICCSDLGPAISDTNWSKMQSFQNQALRVATGCLAMSGIDHLHQEAKVLPLRMHSKMLTKQLLASVFLPNNSDYKHLHQDKSARKPEEEKNILGNNEEIAELYKRGITHKEVIKTLHTSTVQSSISNYAPNRVLQAPPPDINSEEKELDRTSRTSLARLRSGFCRTLSFMSRIDNQDVDSCPNCKESSHQAWKNLKIGRRTRFSGLKWSARERKMSARTTYFPMFFL